ncbi:MAG: hypothetical protein AVDCRST_MAG56-4731 [uncultured Cytophagales bacterium]|uniref:Uncharacterized protein n=1 Tax=uncultured Cytophagales bacterium TaxID=158755 RepID=A0A6J4K0H4_9SPHI|nr:MAG: hypothetical protein AVDCRST_MAG56-4731 [uncultured Cytophagales bacterium]
MSGELLHLNTAQGGFFVFSPYPNALTGAFPKVKRRYGSVTALYFDAHLYKPVIRRLS